jgi:hypothetical protein
MFDVLALGNFMLSAVLSWAWGDEGFVLVDLLCRAGHIVMGGGVGLGEYGKCIMHFWVGFGIELIFSFTVACYHDPIVIIFLSILQHPHALSILS